MKLLKDLTVEDAIVRCGELKIDKSKIPLLLSDKLTKEQQKQLCVNLDTPNSEEYILYAQGIAEGELKLAITLDANTENPKVKDAYKHLSEEQRKKEINKKIAENFGIGEEN